jgi:hypothetical protein
MEQQRQEEKARLQKQKEEEEAAVRIQRQKEEEEAVSRLQKQKEKEKLREEEERQKKEVEAARLESLKTPEEQEAARLEQARREDATARGRQALLSIKQLPLRKLRAAAADAEQSTSAQQTLAAQQRRLEELQLVESKTLVGTNIYNKRERAINMVQKVARGFLLRRRLQRSKFLFFTAKIQGIWRGCLVRKQLARLQAKIKAFERHLYAMDKAKQEELDAIANNAERQSLREQLCDVELLKREKELRKERQTLRDGIQNIKDNNERVQQSMENLRENNRRLGVAIKYVEEQCEKLKKRNSVLEETQKQLRAKAEHFQTKMENLRTEIAAVSKKGDLESTIAGIHYDTIMKVRQTATKAAETSKDPFLVKLHRRSKILQKLHRQQKSNKPPAEEVEQYPVVNAA